MFRILIVVTDSEMILPLNRYLRQADAILSSLVETMDRMATSGKHAGNNTGQMQSPLSRKKIPMTCESRERKVVGTVGCQWCRSTGKIQQ